MKKILVFVAPLIFLGIFASPALADVKFCSIQNNKGLPICTDKYGQSEAQRGCDGNLAVSKFFECGTDDLCHEHWQVEDCSVGLPGSGKGAYFTCGLDSYFGVSCVLKDNVDQVKNAPHLKYAPADPCAGIPEKDSMARFTSISREVEYRRDCNKDGWHPAKPDTVLHVDDHVRTSEDSTAIIGFADLSSFLLKPESEIVVTNPPATDSKLQLLAGNIWVNIKKMAHNGTMEVDMSQAVAGIKGTTFVVSDDGSNSTLKVIEGTVAFTSKADNKTIDVSTGEMATANAAGSGPIQKFDVASESKSWDAIRNAQGQSSNSIIWYILGAVVAVLFVLGYLKLKKKK